MGFDDGVGELGVGEVVADVLVEERPNPSSETVGHQVDVCVDHGVGVPCLFLDGGANRLEVLAERVAGVDVSVFAETGELELFTQALSVADISCLALFGCSDLCGDRRERR